MLLGNTLVGVVLVAVLNYGLTEEHVVPEETGERNKLSIRELFLSGRLDAPLRCLRKNAEGWIVVSGT